MCFFRKIMRTNAIFGKATWCVRIKFSLCSWYVWNKGDKCPSPWKRVAECSRGSPSMGFACLGWPRIYPRIPKQLLVCTTEGKSDSGLEQIHFLLLQAESKRQERVRREIKARRGCLKIIISKSFVSRTGFESSKRAKETPPETRAMTF